LVVVYRCGAFSARRRDTLGADGPRKAGRWTGANGSPIFYNLTPPEDTSVPQDELSRASATIELRRDARLSSAEIYVDGQRRPEALAGPTAYLQTISADIEDLSLGIHTVRVKALDSARRAGGYVWQFTVV
jgi:hypothetical protein